MTKAIGLVTVLGGVAGVTHPAHVDIRVVDLDNTRETRGRPVTLPRGIGFEKLAELAGLVTGIDVVFKDEGEDA